MKKSFIIISLIFVIILSSFSFSFAAETEDYSWLIGKTITFNSILISPVSFITDNSISYTNAVINNFRFSINGLTYSEFDFFPNSGYYGIGRTGSFVNIYHNGSFLSDDYRSITIESLPTRLTPLGSYNNYYLSAAETYSWLFANSNAESFRPVKSVTSELIQPLVNLLSSVRSGISTFFTFVTNAFNDIYSIPAVFPSLWALVPSSVTSVYLGMFVIVTFMGILKFILSK